MQRMRKGSIVLENKIIKIRHAKKYAKVKNDNKFDSRIRKGDLVEILEPWQTILGETIKDSLELNEGEVGVKKITKNIKEQSDYIIEKCNIEDLMLI